MTRYIVVGAIPIEVGFCASAKAYAKQMKEANIVDDQFCLDGAAATTNKFLNKDNYPTALICVDMELTKNWDLHKLAGLMAHEAVHVVEYAIEQMREKNPGEEFRAYTTQYITQSALHYFMKKRSKSND